MAYLLRPDLFITIATGVRVVTGGLAIGQTIFGDPDAGYESPAWKDQPVCTICTGVNPEKVLELYADTLSLAGN